MQKNTIKKEGNKISIIGDFGHYQLNEMLKFLEKQVTDQNEAIELDFSNCNKAFAKEMLSLCIRIIYLREIEKIDFSLTIPETSSLARLFGNANWSFHIDPKNYPDSKFKGFTQIPATRYQADKEQHEIVNKTMNTLLGALPELKREDWANLEWSINEVSDNVLVHSKSVVGGIVQVSFYKRQKKVQFVVADAGIGIPASLRKGGKNIDSDLDALREAIKEGVTTDPKLGQGNGLYGSYSMCNLSKGSFSIRSGYGLLSLEKDALSTKNMPFFHSGTTVEATLNLSRRGLLEEALRIKGKKHIPVGHIENEYETEEGNMIFRLENEASSFGSRVSGTPVRNKLMNLQSLLPPDKKIVIDMKGVNLISSSFADEVFGKLFLELATLQFMSKFHFRNVLPVNRNLIDKAVFQRINGNESH